MLIPQKAKFCPASITRRFCEGRLWAHPSAIDLASAVADFMDVPLMLPVHIAACSRPVWAKKESTHDAGKPWE